MRMENFDTFDPVPYSPSAMSMVHISVTQSDFGVHEPLGGASLQQETTAANISSDDTHLAVRSFGVRLPVEVWEQIIDHLVAGWFEYETHTLWTYGTVCKAWYTRCSFYTRQAIGFHDNTRKQVYRLVKIMGGDESRRNSVKTVTIWKTIDVLGPFSACMAQKLPRVETLCLRRCDWKPGQLHPQIFFHIRAAFASVIRLVLGDVSFPSVSVFGRLVCALPCLSSLECSLLEFKVPVFAPGAVRPRDGLALTNIDLWECDEVMDFLVATSIATGLHHVRLLLDDLDQSTACQRLVSAAGASLSSLYIRPPQDAVAWSDFPLDLGLCTSLTSLTVQLRIRDLAWLVAVISKTPSSKLREIEIKVRRYNLDDVPPEVHYGMLDERNCAELDAILSGSQYGALKTVTFMFQAFVERTELARVPDRHSWTRMLASRLPRLHARGVLRPAVTVEIMESG
ncbi:uncharacterized protein FIBRA_08332 [Fibroporia radiculosa]|uniref:F-box domain-containing protein n=1 Tax=Fibroporia radiculosa TaxID=599839 RepID=J4GWL4_9APHY|nr:uncharacterized protein FIBRA_08332 [Fibroporia radiculosa]CCM06085.1 predicted protein [Fibroporia radiculosa]